LQRLLKIFDLNFSFRKLVIFFIFSIIIGVLLTFGDTLDFLVSLLLLFHVFVLDFIENILNLINSKLLITVILTLILVTLWRSVASCSRFATFIIVSVALMAMRMVLSVMFLKLELCLSLG
jgi:hypothetical protein